MPNERTLKVVLDSVIFISAFLARTKEGLSYNLFRLCITTGILYTTDEILEEVRHVLMEKQHIRGKYLYHDTEIEHFIDLVRENSIIVEPLVFPQVIERDPKDDMIVACAVAARADYIVSRDLDLLDLCKYQGIQIVSPEYFIHLLRDTEGQVRWNNQWK